MSREVKRQLSEIRRQVAKDEIVRMRKHVQGRRQRLQELEVERKGLERKRRLDRKARLDRLRIELSRARSQPAAERRKMLVTIAAKRRAFGEWWAAVRAERAAKLAEIKSLRAELKAFSQQWPERRKMAVAAISAAVHKELATFDAQTDKELQSLGSLIGKARQELKAEEYDLKTWIRNRTGERKTKVTPIKRARELKSELEGNVELNLVNAEEQAWWRKNKPQILRQAKEMHITEPDGIAELVREAVDADPERAVEFLQSDADKWLAAELRKQGYAA